VLGLLAAGLYTSPASAQQLIYDISPNLGHLEVYGYQQSVVQPAQPIITSPMVPPVTGGGAAGGGVSYSGGLSSYGAGAAGPAQQFMIYNPVAVAGMQGVMSRAERTPSWPPKGGPWGVGPVPAPPTTAATPGAELPETIPQTAATPEDGDLEEDESPAPTTGLTAAPRRLVPPYTGGAVGVAETKVRQPVASPLDQYLPSALLNARSHSERSLRTAARPPRDLSTSPRGPVGVAPVYRQQLEGAESASAQLPEPVSQHTTRQADRQLDPIYHQQAAGDNQ
jgi:hypothetical protein